MICIDLETGGLSLNDDILSVSARLLNKNGTPTDIVFSSYIQPTKKPDREALLINNITEEKLVAAPKKKDVVEKLFEWQFKLSEGKQSTPVGHNYCAFDCPRYQLLLGDNLYKKLYHYHAIDTMVIAKNLQQAGFSAFRSVSLKYLVGLFKLQVPEGQSRHNADVDTYMTAFVLNRLLRIVYPSIWTRLIRVVKPQYLGVPFNKDVD